MISPDELIEEIEDLRRRLVDSRAVADQLRAEREILLESHRQARAAASSAAETAAKAIERIQEMQPLCDAADRWYRRGDKGELMQQVRKYRSLVEGRS